MQFRAHTISKELKQELVESLTAAALTDDTDGVEAVQHRLEQAKEKRKGDLVAFGEGHSSAPTVLVRSFSGSATSTVQVITAASRPSSFFS